MKPAIAALLDQADAAAAHAARVMHLLAEAEGGAVQHVQPGRIFRAIISRMQQCAITGQTTLCPHLTYTAPQPAFWCAWAPGRLRCAACAHQANLRVRGTPEDRRCDHCQKTTRTIHPGIAQLPAIVVDLPPFPAGCVPPVTLMFGLCPACQLADKE
jgi:hypothetical protein